MSTGFLHDYPVDPVGHGEARPDPGWPGGARLAVQLSVLAADPLAPAAGAARDPRTTAVEQQMMEARARGAAARRDAAFGARAGLSRLRGLFRRHGVPATWFLAATLAERRAGLVAGLAEEGDEIALLGGPEALAGGGAAVAALAARMAAITGSTPLGWRSTRRHPDGRRALAASGLLYDGDAADDDLPYWVAVAGRGHLVLPATPLSHRRLADPAALLALLLAEAAERPQMLRLELRAGWHGRPDAAADLAALLALLARRSDVWVAPAVALARHWRERHPFTWS